MADLPPSGWYVDPEGDTTRLRYWDGAQWTDRYTAADSKHHHVTEAQERPKPLDTLQRLAIGGLIAVATIEAFSLIGEINRIALDRSFLEGEFITRDEIQRADDLDQIAAIAVLVGYFLIAPLTFIPWFHRAYSNLVRLGFREIRYAPGWAIGGWFIPIINLFRPKQIANDIYRGSTPGLAPESKFWETQPLTLLLSWWWGLWIVTNFLGGVGANAFDPEDDLTALTARQAVRDEQAALVLTAVGSVAAIVGAALAIKVVIDLTRRQEEAVRVKERTEATSV